MTALNITEFMGKLKNPREEQGVSVVLGAVLLVGIFIGIFSFLYGWYIRSSIYSSERSHMEDVQSMFLKLKSEIESMDAGKSGSVDIRMNPIFPPLVPGQGEVGTLSLKPGVAWVHGASAENVEGYTLGTLDALKGDDGVYLRINQIIFFENFPDTSRWSLTTGIDDIDTYTPAFDKEVTQAQDGSGSIHVSVLARAKKSSSTENAYWEHDFGNLLENYPKVTIQAWFRKIYSYVGTSANAAKAEWRIDVENLIWNTGVVSLTDNYPISMPWKVKTSLSPVENVKKIRAYMSAYVEQPQPASWGQAFLDLWMDDISLMKGPPFETDITISSERVISPKNVENVKVLLNFCSEESPAYYTLQIRNFSGYKWENIKSGIVGEDEVTWENLFTNPENYIDNDGIIKIRIRGENESSPFTLCLDYLEIRVNYENQFQQYYLDYYGRSGRIEFKMKNNYYPSQTHVYEDGALILAQGDTSIMISTPNPDLVVIKPAGDNNIEVHVNHFVVKGSEGSIARKGWLTVRVSEVGSYYTVRPGNKPNRENVVIEINSPYLDAWTHYLSGLEGKLNEKGYNASLRIEGVVPFEWLTFTIKGKDNDTTPENDIYYYEKFTEINVNLA